MIGKTQLSALGLFQAKLPRYTSYPTAPHFSETVQAEQFTSWVSSLPEDRTISLYLHIPFCRRLCWFCACRTQGTKTDAPVRAYLDVLKSELGMLKKILPEGVRLSRLHWGGGTPTLLSASMIEELSTKIRETLAFAPDMEFSVEIDPNEIDAPRLDALAAAGMNRASIGVQDFDPFIQETIGRLQSYEITRDAVEALRARGIKSLNADILYGLPHQNGKRITESVQKLLSLSPDRVALYGYAHVPWMAKRQQLIPSDAIPTPEERLDLFKTARQLFAWDGYDEIGIDHFAVPDDSLSKAKASGTLRRNFQGYTDDTAETLIGLGASSISRFPQGYAQNTSATSAYMKAIRDGSFATARGHVFSDDDLLRARLIEAVMCDFKVSAEEITRQFGLSRKAVFELLHKTASEFDGLIQVNDDGLYIPYDSRALTRMIARSFDAYDLSRAGHSPAI